MPTGSGERAVRQDEREAHREHHNTLYGLFLIQSHADVCFSTGFRLFCDLSLTMPSRGDVTMLQHDCGTHKGYLL